MPGKRKKATDKILLSHGNPVGAETLADGLVVLIVAGDLVQVLCV